MNKPKKLVFMKKLLIKSFRDNKTEKLSLIKSNSKRSVRYRH